MQSQGKSDAPSWQTAAFEKCCQRTSFFSKIQITKCLPKVEFILQERRKLRKSLRHSDNAFQKYIKRTHYATVGSTTSHAKTLPGVTFLCGGDFAVGLYDPGVLDVVTDPCPASLKTKIDMEKSKTLVIWETMLGDEESGTIQWLV